MRQSIRIDKCCAKDPGFPIDVVFRGKVADFVAAYLGHAIWHQMEGKGINFEGDRCLAREAAALLRLDKIIGHD